MIQKVRRIILAGLLIAILIIGLLPAGSGRNAPAANVDVLLVIDRTTSMAAKDYAEGQIRLVGVAEDVKRLVAAMPNSRFAVLVADNQASLALPWTFDVEAVSTLAATVGWRDEAHGSGSDIGVAAKPAADLLAAAAESRPDNKRYFVYFGDGEQTSANEPSSFAPLRPFLDDALVLGYGSEEGAEMLSRPGSEELVTRAGQHPVSRIDEGNLARIADELGASYLHRTGSAEATQLPAWSAPSTPQASADLPLPLEWLLGLSTLILLLWELWDTAGKVRLLREETK